MTGIITDTTFTGIPFDAQAEIITTVSGIEQLSHPTLNDTDMTNDDESRKHTRLLVATLDNLNWRIYLNSTTWVGAPEYVNKFCRFMDTRSADMTVELYLGAWTNEIASLQIGSILRSIEQCQAKVTTIANGYCGLTETMMWVHGATRRVGKYGGLKFGGGEFIHNYPNCANYIKTFLKKCIDIEILTQEQVNNITERNQEIFMTGSDLTIHPITT